MAVSFDTHKAVTRLRRKAGFDENQAMAVVETVSDLLVDNLATREDLGVLRSDMKAGRRMTTRLGAVAVAAVGIMAAFDKLL